MPLSWNEIRNRARRLRPRAAARAIVSGAQYAGRPSRENAGQQSAAFPYVNGKLFEFHKKLRKLELEVLRTVHEGPGSRFLDIHQEISVGIDQFHGIEIEEFPAQIAQVALWLMDHQMNVRVSEEFGMYFACIPLKTSPHIVHGNALMLDWNDVLPAECASYVFGNPPFVGAKFMDDAQREDAQRVFADIKSGGLLDFVAAWYVKAARYMTTPSDGTTSHSTRRQSHQVAGYPALTGTLPRAGGGNASGRGKSVAKGEGVVWQTSTTR